MNTKVFWLALVAGLLLISAPPSFAAFPGLNGKIAFTRNPGNGNLQIWVMNHDGTGQTNLTNNANYYYSNPRWSPDGTKLAFTSNENNDGNFDIWVMNADGTDLQNLTNSTTHHESWPAWSPDGAKIAFSRSPIGGTTGANLWIMDADGNDLCQRTFNTAYSPFRFWRRLVARW